MEPSWRCRVVHWFDIWLLIIRAAAVAVAERCWKAVQLSHQSFTILVFLGIKTDFLLDWNKKMCVNVFSSCPAEGALHLHHKEAIDLVYWMNSEILHFFIVEENVSHLLQSFLARFNKLNIHSVASGGSLCLGGGGSSISALSKRFFGVAAGGAQCDRVHLPIQQMFLEL